MKHTDFAYEIGLRLGRKSPAAASVLLVMYKVGVWIGTAAVGSFMIGGLIWAAHGAITAPPVPVPVHYHRCLVQWSQDDKSDMRVVNPNNCGPDTEDYSRNDPN